MSSSPKLEGAAQLPAAHQDPVLVASIPVRDLGLAAGQAHVRSNLGTIMSGVTLISKGDKGLSLPSEDEGAQSWLQEARLSVSESWASLGAGSHWGG